MKKDGHIKEEITNRKSVVEKKKCCHLVAVKMIA